MKNFIATKYQNMSSPMGESKVINKSSFPTINLGIGDLDITTDKIIIEKAYKDALNGHTHYTNPAGYLELRKEICKYHKENFKNYNFSTDEVLVTSGACHGLYLLFKTILNPNDEIILLSPFFAVYSDAIKLSDGIPVIVETKFENKFQLIKEDIEKKITNKTKAIILNSPCNPTGVCYNLESLNIIKELAIKYDLLVIADDVYDFYSFEKNFTPIYTLPDMKERTISVCSFSKDFAMTGWRIGYIIGQKDILECMNLINQSIVYSPVAISQRAALYALKEFKRIKETQVPFFRERVMYAYKRIKQISFLDCVKPQGGIYLFINIEKTKMTSIEFTNFLIENYGIVTIPGDGFGTPGFIRIACTVNIETLKEAFDRIEKLIFE
ncbi:aminotransferase class I/II-fold pyridoxal phosphate-dependent enzyme [Fusobacterium perfoetens]|uniref:aminotransferase class I/II-fold pyridoxal phosphate-dependent enzyme n=1 Tax=Fusobacterium perfoetens TaxID=852 RepID=UPI0004834CD2|nr:aminotransferase class I/II-fold pyridoxal phosphate-dependent enzyme [Fusobacterium perfoetens]